MVYFSGIFLKILVATALGALIGLERERSHKSAGLRTNALVAMGSALISAIAISSFQDNPFIDPTRMISNIIVGIGFIGGGVILREGGKIHGITTAATLWVVAAIGMVVGMGFYREALFSVIVVYFVLTILWLIEKRAGRKILYQSIREEEKENE